jgi:hypothetical protein
MTRDDKVVGFPTPNEETARRLRVEVERLARLVALAKRLGKDLDTPARAFTELVAVNEKIDVVEAEAYPEPVDAKVLLDETEAQFRRYMVIHDDAAATTYALTVPFTWVQDEIATNSFCRSSSWQTS